MDYEKLETLLESENYNEFIDVISQMNEVDIASFLNHLEFKKVLEVFNMLPKDIVADVFSELDPDIQITVMESLANKEIRFLMEELAIDDVVDMVEKMTEEMAQKVLTHVAHETRETIKLYLNYPENSVGTVMTAEYSSLRKDMTVKSAIEYIRKTGENKESIYICYVVDSENKLIGAISIRDLLTAKNEDVVLDIMNKNIISVNTTTDKEEAAYLLGRYNFVALPVVDDDNVLVGILTVDDAADIIVEETTEDIEKMAGMAPSEKPYLKTSIIKLAQNRILWLLVLMLSGIISEMILRQYEDTISLVPLLAAFIPLLTDIGGDAGSQVSALIIRGIALDEIYSKHLPKMLGKEILVSIIVGIPLAVINFIRIKLEYPGDGITAFAISLTLLCTIVMANSLGVILPMIAKKLKIDPALMATPMIATLVDILSILIYFAIASALIF